MNGLSFSPVAAIEILTFPLKRLGHNDNVPDIRRVKFIHDSCRNPPVNIRVRPQIDTLVPPSLNGFDTGREVTNYDLFFCR